MGISERKEREKAELRAKIIDAARELFATHGFENVSMRQVAQAIEYSPTAIYLYFKDKEDLFREICSEDYAAFSKVFVKIAGVSDPIERIRQSGFAYARFGIKHPNHYRLMFLSPHSLEPTERELERKGDPARDGYAFLVQAVQDGLKQGRFRPDLKDAHLVAQTLWAIVHGVVSLEINRTACDWAPVPALEKRLTVAVDAMLDGLCKGAAGGKP